MNRINFDKVIEQVQKWLGLKQQFKRIGAGSYGVAYINDQNPELVYKLTSDSSEVRDAKIISKLNNSAFAKIYHIYTITVKDMPVNTWLIIKEKVEPLTKRTLDELSKIIYEFGKEDFPYQDNYLKLVCDKKNLNYPLALQYNNLYRITSKYLKNKTGTVDLNGGNIGYRIGDKSQMVVFDTGGYDYTHPIKNIGNINIDPITEAITKPFPATMTSDEMRELLVKYGRDAYGRLDYDDAKHMTYGNYELQDVDVEVLKQGNLIPIDGIDLDYKSKSKFPIIVNLHDGDYEIVDGKNRFSQAYHRGDKTIKAYVSDIEKYERSRKMNESISVFHGSTTKFKSFDVNKIGSGDGKDLGGWGFYFSDSKEVAERYTVKSGMLKQFSIPDGEYFDFDDSLDEYLAENIIKQLRKMPGIDDSNIEEFETDFISYIPEVINKQVYEWLSYVTGSQKNASIFISKLGFIGNRFKDRWDSNATNYVIFNPKNIK